MSLESKSNLIEIIEKVTATDRTQASRKTKNVCQDLLDHVQKQAPSATFQILEISTADRPSALGIAMPDAWELLAGNIIIGRETDQLFCLKHSKNPMLIGTNSDEFRGKVRISKLENRTSCLNTISGSLALVPGPKSEYHTNVKAAVMAGAIGVATATHSKVIAHSEARGRIEIPAASNYFAISLLPSEYNHLEKELDRNSPLVADIEISVDRTGTLPILEIRTHNNAQNEILLCAHICHLRPGANDNASGIAVLCELLRRNCDSLPPLRIIFAPEFTGLSAYISATGFRPIFVINMDMVGSDSKKTGAELEIECAPSYLQHEWQDQLIETFKSSNKLNFSVKEFCGYSDHAIFAAKCIATTAIQIGQTGDLYNHTHLDTIENLNIDQMIEICDLLETFLRTIKIPEYSAGANRLSQTASTLPFNLYSLLENCETKVADEIKSRIAKDKGTYADLQRAYLRHQWKEELRTTEWAKEIIKKAYSARESEQDRHRGQTE